MNMRLKKVLDDIQKTENKILELQEHVRQLRIQKKQMEDAEIIKAIRSMKMDSRKMLTFLDGIQNGASSRLHYYFGGLFAGIRRSRKSSFLFGRNEHQTDQIHGNG